jgi:aerobic carbon-monoxide dehydrogenase small subunit
MSLHIKTLINAVPFEFLCKSNETALQVLRDRLMLTGTKEGCNSGDCGACSILINNQLVCACLVLAAELNGQKVITIEGIASGNKLHPVQNQLMAHNAFQCGICIPGIVVAAKALLDSNPDPDEEEIRFWMAGNLCRCTGYDKIVRAIQDAAKEIGGTASVD